MKKNERTAQRAVQGWSWWALGVTLVCCIVLVLLLSALLALPFWQNGYLVDDLDDDDLTGHPYHPHHHHHHHHDHH